MQKRCNKKHDELAGARTKNRGAPFRSVQEPALPTSVPLTAIGSCPQNSPVSRRHSRMTKVLLVLVTAIALLMSSSLAAQQVRQRMTNQDVIDMVALGLPDDVIIEKIHTIDLPQFDTSVQGLRMLKAGKLSDALIRVMINPRLGTATAASESSLNSLSQQSGLPQEIGVYYTRNNEMTQLDPEIVGWQTGGVLKHYGTLGVDREHVNGKIMRARSRVQLSCPVDFWIKTPEGTSVTEYQLLRLYKKGNRREFRALTGGVYHASGGAERNAVSFSPEKMSSRLWRVRLSGLSSGEYGFLPPGVAASSIAASGKIYSFGIEGESRHHSTKVEPESFDPREPSSCKLASAEDKNTQAPQKRPSPTALGPHALGFSCAAWAEGGVGGVEILEVAPGGPAEIAGLHLHDVITAVNGRNIRSTDDLNSVLAQTEPGSPIAVSYIFKSNLGWMPKKTSITPADN